MRCSFCQNEGPDRLTATSLIRWCLRLSQVTIGLALTLSLAYFAFAATHEETTEPDYRPSFDGWEGVEAPELEITFLDGRIVKLSELRGRRVVLDFWATWCPPCLEEIPHFNDLAGESFEDDLIIIGISAEDEDTLKTFVEEEGVAYPIASMDFLISPYGDVTGLPTTFFIDRNGVIQTVLSGYHELEQLRASAHAEDYAEEVNSPPSSTQVNAKDGAGHTRLAHAAMEGETEAVEALIADGADLELQDDRERTPLIHATKNAQSSTVLALLKQGADVNVKDDFDMDALFHAARAGDADTVRILLDHGADSDTRNLDGATPMTAARQRRHDDVVALLEPALEAVELAR